MALCCRTMEHADGACRRSMPTPDWLCHWARQRVPTDRMQLGNSVCCTMSMLESTCCYEGYSRTTIGTWHGHRTDHCCIVDNPVAPYNAVKRKHIVSRTRHSLRRASVAYYLLHAVCCVLSIACCMLSVACCGLATGPAWRAKIARFQAPTSRRRRAYVSTCIWAIFAQLYAPKRRFWKAEPTSQNAFSKHFSRV